MKPVLAPLVAALFAWTTTAWADAPPPQAPEQQQSLADLQSKLLGTWKGGPCQGVLILSKDGTFERRHDTPGNNEVRGTWKVRWNALPPTLVMTCKSSDDPEQFPVDRIVELKLVRLDAERLDYESPGSTAVEYERMPPSAEAADRLRGVVVQGKMTQVIGRFSSHGGPEIGDTFELDFDHLPADRLKLVRPGEKNAASYIPLRAPLGIERMKSSKPVTGDPRSAIDLATTDAPRELRIRIIADGLTAGSKVHIIFFEADDFLGSMAEAEGAVK